MEKLVKPDVSSALVTRVGTLLSERLLNDVVAIVRSVMKLSVPAVKLPDVEVKFSLEGSVGKTEVLDGVPVVVVVAVVVVVRGGIVIDSEQSPAGGGHVGASISQTGDPGTSPMGALDTKHVRVSSVDLPTSPT